MIINHLDPFAIQVCLRNTNAYHTFGFDTLVCAQELHIFQELSNS